MDKVHYELEVLRNGQWHFNQRQPTLTAACRHEEIVRSNKGSTFDDVRIVEVRLSRTVVKKTG